MRKFTLDLQAAQRQSMAIPPSSFLYVESITTDRAINLRAFGADGETLANLEAVAAGTRLRVDPLGTRFVTVEVSNTSTTDNTVVLYVGTDEIKPPVVSGGGGGGGGAITGTVSIDSARGLTLYSAELNLTTTATDVKAALPAGATVSDWAFKVSAGAVILSGTSVGAGMTFEVGKGLAGSNSYPLYLRAASGTAKAQVLVTYR